MSESELKNLIIKFLDENTVIGKSTERTDAKFAGSFDRNDLFQLLDRARKDIFAVFPKETVIGTRVGGDGDEYNAEGYSKEDIEKLRVVLLEWFGEEKK